MGTKWLFRNSIASILVGIIAFLISYSGINLRIGLLSGVIVALTAFTAIYLNEIGKPKRVALIVFLGTGAYIVLLYTFRLLGVDLMVIGITIALFAGLIWYYVTVWEHR